MDIVALWLGWMLAWALGVALLAALHRGASWAGPGEWTLLAGAGFFAGQFALTLWMRILSILGVPFGTASIAGPLAVAAVVAAGYALRSSRVRAFDARSVLALLRPDVANVPRVMWFAILGWLALRFVLLLIDVLLRPLYPWDAWTQWATKAHVWYALKWMAPFVTASQWLAAPAAGLYVDAAPGDPATVPLIQAWSATLLGRWDDALVNLPWWLAAASFGLAFYGALRRQPLGPLAALVGAWLVLSLPILDAHVALAGYADLAMAAYFTLTALTALRFARTRDVRDLVLALVFACASITVKNAGAIWIAVLIPGLVAAMLPRHGLRIVAVYFALLGMAALVLARTGLTLLGRPLQLQFDMPWGRLQDAYFAYANWHLLFYGAIGVALLGRRHLLSRELAPLTIVVAGGLAFVLFGFGVTHGGAWLEDPSSINRATLHLAPLIVVWMLMTFRSWSLAYTTSGAARGTGPAPQRAAPVS